MGSKAASPGTVRWAREGRQPTLQIFEKEEVVVVVLEEGATIVRGYFAKILLLLPPSLARSQAA